MIFYFSGTGNSGLVALRLAELTGDRTMRIGARTPRRIEVASGERVVWVFPVYSWGVPPVVRRFMADVELTDADGLHSMVCTCGDDAGLTYEMWRSCVRRRGWRCGGGWSVTMPNTYVCLPGFDVDSQRLMREKLDAMPLRVKEVARAISHDSKVEDVVRGSFAMFKTRVLYPLFTRVLMSPKPFRCTEACVGCGRCARVCPMNNIVVSDGNPVWGEECAGCLACYHVCPQHAVAYGSRTRGKGQYFCADGNGKCL